MDIPVSYLADGYKYGHHVQYPNNTSLVYTNETPRSNKYAPPGCGALVSIGQSLFAQWIHDKFNTTFFNMDRDTVCNELGEELSLYLGADYNVDHFKALHDLGYLPVKIKAIKEGAIVPMKIPIMVIYNTHPEFGWLTNFLETIASNMQWQMPTSATIALRYKRILTRYAKESDKDNLGFVDFQGHDFSMRGMGGDTGAVLSGLGHASVFLGSDTVPVIWGARKYYGEKGFVVGSVNATEHSVMCAGTKDDEIGTFRRLIKDVYPTETLSIVSDTWNLWDVLTKYCVVLKDEIMSRDGKVVFRPDSGDPVDIICGNPEGETEHEKKGVVELLWDVFGGHTNEQGFKVLSPKVGAIYGDSITPDRAEEICRRLLNKGFASTNVVLGIGSFTYQYNTRDTFGLAFKATYIEVTENGETVGREIFKDPITDDGIKKSAKGLLQVYIENGEYKLKDQCTWEEEAQGELQTIYQDGEFFNKTTLTEIRTLIASQV
jgi:nicotinamide phosphoribosyltransferase